MAAALEWCGAACAILIVLRRHKTSRAAASGEHLSALIVAILVDRMVASIELKPGCLEVIRYWSIRIYCRGIDVEPVGSLGVSPPQFDYNVCKTVCLDIAWLSPDKRREQLAAREGPCRYLEPSVNVGAEDSRLRIESVGILTLRVNHDDVRMLVF